MTILINTDHNIIESESMRGNLITYISGEMKRFSEHITRIEVHLSDENGNKEGQNDKRCLLEARLEGMQPIAVSSNADTTELAVEGAVTKIQTSLDTILGRLKKY